MKFSLATAILSGLSLTANAYKIGTGIHDMTGPGRLSEQDVETSFVLSLESSTATVPQASLRDIYKLDDDWKFDMTQ